MPLNRVSLVKDYHPWSAEFVDGTFVSRMMDPELTFDAVREKQELLYAFYIHFDWDRVAGVRVADGLFYHGSRPGDAEGWLAPPGFCPGLQYRLNYSRQCEGRLVEGKIKAAVVGYTLGWTASLEGQPVQTEMRLTPDGNYRWFSTSCRG